jgi:hypothetical protein
MLRELLWTEKIQWRVCVLYPVVVVVFACYVLSLGWWNRLYDGLARGYEGKQKTHTWFWWGKCLGIQDDFVFIIKLVLSDLGYNGDRRKKLAEDGVQFIALILFSFCCIWMCTGVRYDVVIGRPKRAGRRTTSQLLLFRNVVHQLFIVW